MDTDQPALPRISWNNLQWLTPLWPALCGALGTLRASGGLAPMPGQAVRLALFLLLAEGGWGMFWQVVAVYDWTAALAVLDLAEGPGGSLRARLGRLRHVPTSEASARLSLHLVLAALALALMLILPAVLGPASAAYSVVLLAAALWVRRIGHTPAVVDLMLLGLGPWWVAAWTWGGLSGLSLSLSLAYALCLAGLWPVGGLPLKPAPLYGLGLGAAVGILLVGQHALAGGVAGLCFWAALPRLNEAAPEPGALRWPLAVAMLAAALAPVWSF